MVQQFSSALAPWFDALGVGLVIERLRVELSRAKRFVRRSRAEPAFGFKLKFRIQTMACTERALQRHLLVAADLKNVRPHHNFSKLFVHIVFNELNILSFDFEWRENMSILAE